MRCAPVLAVLAAAALTVLTGACSSSSDEASSEAVVLRGAYLPKSANGASALSGIVFDGTRYVLRAKECNDAQCEERGTFAIDTANHLLSLTVDGSGHSYSMPFQVLATREEKGAAASLGAKPSSLQGALRPTDTGDGKLVDAQGTLVVKDGVSLTIAIDVQLSGQDFAAGDADGVCGKQQVFTGEGACKTRTYLGNDADRAKVGGIACDKAKEDAEKNCKKSPWVCTASASGTKALDPDCDGVLDISCTCTATTKCNFELKSPF